MPMTGSILLLATLFNIDELILIAEVNYTLPNQLKDGDTPG